MSKQSFGSESVVYAEHILFFCQFRSLIEQIAKKEPLLKAGSRSLIWIHPYRIQPKMDRFWEKLV